MGEWVHRLQVRRWRGQQRGPHSKKCLIALLGGQEIQRKGLLLLWENREEAPKMTPRNSYVPGEKSKQQQEGNKAPKKLRDGDLNDLFVKNIGFRVRQPQLKGLAWPHPSCVDPQQVI